MKKAAMVRPHVAGVFGVILACLTSGQSWAGQTVVPQFDTYYDTPSHNVLCKAGHLVTFYDNGYLESCTVPDGFQLVGKTGGNGEEFYSCSAAQPVELYADGYLNHCVLKADIQVGGHNGPNGGVFYPCKAGNPVQIYADGYLASCTLTRAMNTAGRYGSNTVLQYTCKEGASMEIRSDGYLSSCTLGYANWVQSSNGMKACDAGSLIYIDSSGNGICGNY